MFQSANALERIAEWLETKGLMKVSMCEHQRLSHCQLIGVAGNDEANGLGESAQDADHEFLTAHTWHGKIGYDDIHRILRENIQSLFPTLRAEDFVILTEERSKELIKFLNQGIVIDEQNPMSTHKRISAELAGT